MTKTRLAASLKGFVLALAVILILNTAPGRVTADPVKSPKDKSLVTVPIEEITEEIAAEFRKIRKIKGHFDGEKWNDEVDQWMGRKHRLMIELGVRLSKGKYQKSDISKLLDPPDRIVKKGHDLFKLITAQPGYDSLRTGSYEFLVYYWRGKHDFLFFTCDKTVIVNSGWWYAGE